MSRTEYRQAYYKKNKERILARTSAYYKNNKAKVRVWQKKDRADKRLLCLREYGNKCTCCGEERTEFLSIDHVNGDGAAHRKKLSGKLIYLWLIRNGFPKDGFRILCHNCNCARGFYGYCPHERENIE